MRRIAPLLMVLVVAIASVPPAAAQATTASVSGIVADQSGAAVPGAMITVTNRETGFTRAVLSDEAGRYRVQALDPGRYDIAAELPGFQTSVRSDVPLSVGQDLAVNVVLNLGQFEEQIVITEAPPLVETRNAALSYVVDARQIRELPLLGRDFTQLTLLQPGVTPAVTASRGLVRGMGTQISIAGARPNQVSYLLDGTDVNDGGNQSPGSAAGGLLGVETVREFQVLTNNFSAEYGNSAGGVVSAVTRSGTNTLQGTAFEFFRHDSLIARNYFDPKDAPIAPFVRNQFGFYLGGPIARNRTFYFGSYEGLRQERRITSVRRVPSRATRSRADIHSSIRPYLELYPLPNGPESGPSGLYTTTVSEPTDEDYAVVKINHTLSERTSLAARYSISDSDVLAPVTPGFFANQLRSRSQYFLLEERRVLGASLLNVARLAFNRSFIADGNVTLVDIDPSLYFIPGTLFGTLSVSGLDAFGSDSGVPTVIAFNSFQIHDTLTWTRGRHALKAGVSLTRWHNNQDSGFTVGGSYNFTSIEDFVQGRPNTFEGQVPGSTADRYWRQSLVGLFVQDELALSPRLTLNAGLRYEIITVPREKYGRVANLRRLTDADVTVGDPLFKNPSLRNLAPRAGFAWDVRGDGKTSIRGGGGLFYEPIRAQFYRALGNRTPPYFQAANVARPPFPHALGGPLVVQRRLDLFTWEPENPYTIQYNVSAQHEILPQMVVSAGYVGARGYHLIRNKEANQALAQVLPDGRYFFPANSVRRNPSFESIRLRDTDGNGWYNGLVAGLSKRFAAGLQFQASYTLGRSTDEGTLAVGSNDFDGGLQPRYADDRHDNKGPSDYDIRHNLVFNYSYDLPFGREASGATRALVGGWQISGIVHMQSGVPLTPVLGFDRARARPRSGGGGQRPDRAPGFGGPVIAGGPEQYFDPLAFSLPEAGTFGDATRNMLTGPGYATWDAAVIKNITVKGKRLQARVEIFNLLNRVNFGQPAATIFNSAGRVASAGEITSTIGSPREVQLGVKLEF